MKPSWLKILPPTAGFHGTKAVLGENDIVTVCQEAHCPNTAECWSGGTATFMILGDACTRACKFCAVKTAYPAPAPNANEPKKLAAAVEKLGLDYVVITSVDRDDLPDQGAGHFAECIISIRQKVPHVKIEVLIPDFRGNTELIDKIIEARPDVIGHNIETVERLQKSVRDPRAGYGQSLAVLEHVKKINPGICTKSSIMLGLGEQEDEVIQTMKDLRTAGAGILTMGQYLQPSKNHLKVTEYIRPEKFSSLKEKAEGMGFLYVASGPLVRSSYRAGELFMAAAKSAQAIPLR